MVHDIWRLSKCGEVAEVILYSLSTLKVKPKVFAWTKQQRRKISIENMGVDIIPISAGDGKGRELEQI